MTTTPPAPAQEPPHRRGQQPPPRRRAGEGQHPNRYRPPAAGGDRLPLEALPLAELRRRYPTPTNGPAASTPAQRAPL